jgi:hypothetical protein
MPLIDELEPTLRGHGIDVEAIEPGGEAITVRYTTAFPDVHVNRQELGRVLQGLMEAYEHTGADPVDVQAAVYRSPGDRQGRWQVQGDDMAAYMAYRIDGAELSARVLESLTEE